MQVPKDTPDELAALTKPLEPGAKRVPKKQLKETVSAPRTNAMASRGSGPAAVHTATAQTLKFI
jgi:hypothetical protein